MKRSLNIFAEVLALPYSELFIKTDPIRESSQRSEICNRRKPVGKRLNSLKRELNKEFSDVLAYLNQYVEIHSLTELQSYIHYAFNAKRLLDIADAPEFNSVDDAVNQYYIDLMLQHANTLLTTRDGIVMLRPWDAQNETLFHLRDGQHMKADSVKRSAFRSQKLELWNSLLRCLPEDMFISFYAANCAWELSSPLLRRDASRRVLESFGDTVRIADALIDRILDKGMAETHLHAGACRSFGLIWEGLLRDALLQKPVLEKDSYKLPFKGDVEETELQTVASDAAVARLIMASYLQSPFQCLEDYLFSDWIAPGVRTSILRGIIDIYTKGHPDGILSDNVKPGIPFLIGGARQEASDLWPILDLPPELRFSCPTLAERCFMCWSVLHTKEWPEDAFFTSLFLYYLRLRAKVYRQRVEDSKCLGLSYFQNYYSASTDTGALDKNEKMQEVFYTTLRDKRVLKTELRLSPPKSSEPTLEGAAADIKRSMKSVIRDFMRQHIYTLVLKYRLGDVLGDRELAEDYTSMWRRTCQSICDGKEGSLKALLRHYGIETTDIAPHRFGIVFHLIKTGEENEKLTCFARENDVSEKDRYAKFLFGTARFGYEACVKAISDLRNCCPAMSRLIVGLDAASLEIPTEPWVFTTSFREARKRNAGVDSTAKKSLLGITYHVGEDFRHPLSGLRHIDEAISYLRMHPGDRIGHGLAMGIDLNRWFSGNKIVVLPQVEWMENNLWLWGLISNDSSLVDLAGYIEAIERQILECAIAIFGRLDGITTEILYRAYLSKTLSVQELDAKARNLCHKLNSNTDCFKEIDVAGFFPCWNTEAPEWTEDTLSLSYHCGFYKHRMEEIIMHLPTDEEIALTKRLQIYIREKVADFGLIVESNPSSNATISDMNGIVSHPIYEFRKETAQRVMTSINTDDPSVFNATVANEHAQIYYALRDHGYSVEDSLDQVDTLRKIGLQSSFIRDVGSIDVLLQDYEEIIQMFK